jgi:4'-phosphopantetheinyl transferase
MICVWRIAVDQPSHVRRELRATLTVDDRRRISRLRLARDRRRTAVRRATVRTILGFHAGVPPSSIRFCYSALGKPSLAAPSLPELRFSVAYSAGLAVVAVANGLDVGIDVEQFAPLRIETMATSVLTPGEENFVASLSVGERNRALFRLWTLKEAVLKATGEGLTCAPAEVDVARALAARSPIVVARRGLWQLRELDVCANFAGALATKDMGRPVEVTIRDWNYPEIENPSQALTPGEVGGRRG